MGVFMIFIYQSKEVQVEISQIQPAFHVCNSKRAGFGPICFAKRNGT
jgi:hypothetical protein